MYFSSDLILSMWVDNWKNLFPTGSKIRTKLEDLLVEMFFLFDKTFWNDEANKFNFYPPTDPLIKDILSLQYHSYTRLETEEELIKEEEVDSILTHLKENYHTSYSSDPVVRKFILSRMEKMVHSFKESPVEGVFPNAEILLEKVVKIDKKEFQQKYPIKMNRCVEIYVPEIETGSSNLCISDLKSFGITIFKDKNYSKINSVSLGYFFQPHPSTPSFKYGNSFESLSERWVGKDPLGKKNPLETYFLLLAEEFSYLLFEGVNDKDEKLEIAFSPFRSALSYPFYVIKEDSISHLDIEVDRKKNYIKVTPYVFLK